LLHASETVILEGKCVLPGENARPYIKETDYKDTYEYCDDGYSC
jgi:hypothetical protein